MIRTLALTFPAILILAWFGAGTAADGNAEGKKAIARDNPAINMPDKFAWELFIEINQPAKPDAQPVLWETWATDAETFPSNPDAAKPPQWPGSTDRPKALRPSRQLQLFRSQLQRMAGADGPHRLMAVGDQQETRRNKPTFDFIIANQLWHLDGIAAAYKAGKTVDFPGDSIEVKAQWKRIDEKDKPRYHWNTDGSGQLFGLIALHISSKALPNWFWATFEHVDNSERGKTLGYHDAFGVVPPKSADGKVSPALDAMFKKAGMGAQWQNYRLDGSQTEFTDSTGRPTLLGNSEIEGPFMATSSCITCHARAAADGNGVFLRVFKDSNTLEGNVGTPNPDWYFNSNGNRKVIQLDFVWGFMAASPLQSNK